MFVPFLRIVVISVISYVCFLLKTSYSFVLLVLRYFNIPMRLLRNISLYYDSGGSRLHRRNETTVSIQQLCTLTIIIYCVKSQPLFVIVLHFIAYICAHGVSFLYACIFHRTTIKFNTIHQFIFQYVSLKFVGILYVHFVFHLLSSMQYFLLC